MGETRARIGGLKLHGLIQTDWIMLSEMDANGLDGKCAEQWYDELGLVKCYHMQAC